MGREPGLLASRDVLGPKITLVGRRKMCGVFTTFLFERFDLFRQILDPRTAGHALLGIARVEPEIIFQLLVGRRDEFLQ